MDLNKTPRSVRVHIGFFGKRNSGKSSLINAVTGQSLAIVSEYKGTTTDPVYKSMEILPIGPCELIDTAGLDDEGSLGQMRIEKTLEVLNKTDVAIYVVDAAIGLDEKDEELLINIRQKKIPLVIAFNKIDLLDKVSANQDLKNHIRTEVENDNNTLNGSLEKNEEIFSLNESKNNKTHYVSTIIDDDNKKYFYKSSNEDTKNEKTVYVSSTTNTGVNDLKLAIISLTKGHEDSFRIVGDLVSPGDFVVLVTPIDKAAPKGRLILPQQQVIRDILENDAIGIITKEHELRHTLMSLGKKPKLIITDSQVFLKVSADTPKDIWLTSFSILFARLKGDLNEMVKGAAMIDRLKDNDKILIVEGCTHHQQSDDIGKVKIPRWLREKTGKELEFHYAHGSSYGSDISQYALIVHCGACMINNTEMKYRIDQAKEKGVPIVNYGVLIAYVQGILDRVLEPFPLAKLIWDENKN